MNKKLFFIFFIILAFGISFIWYYKTHPLSASITINKTKFYVTLALTDGEKKQGLSSKTTLAPKHGMLFVYGYKEKHQFWMKDMQFPLDFVWIADTTVVDITKNVPPATESNMHVVVPIQPVNKILELNAGEVEQYNIQIGNIVTFNK